MKLAFSALILVILGQTASGGAPDGEKSAPPSDDGADKPTMSLDDAMSLREGQVRVYRERNAMAPGLGELRFTNEARVKAVIKQADGSRAFVIEQRTLKSESQDPVTMEWRKEKTTAFKADPVGARTGFLASRGRLARWQEGSTWQEAIAEFPAKDGEAFTTTSRTGKVVTKWRWSSVAEMKTPAGRFSGCFAASNEGATGTKIRRTWCPGIGLVEDLLTTGKGGEARTELLSYRGPGFVK